MLGFSDISAMAKEQAEFDALIQEAKLAGMPVRKFRDTKVKVNKEKKKAKRKQANKSRKNNRGK